MPTHTLPVVEQKWPKVQVDLDPHDTLLSFSVKKTELAHKFVESTKRVENK
jgi:hypothetical protein